MELLILFAVIALLLLGPRRGGTMPGPAAVAIALIFLVWLALAFGVTGCWRAVVGNVPQP